MNEARVYRQTTSTSTTTLTMTAQLPSLEKVRLNGNGEQITLFPYLLPVSSFYPKSPPTPPHRHPVQHPSPSLPHTSLGSRFALCHQSVDDFQRCQLAHNFVVANGQRDVCGEREGEGGNEQQLCRLGVIKIYAWTAA